MNRQKKNEGVLLVQKHQINQVRTRLIELKNALTHIRQNQISQSTYLDSLEANLLHDDAMQFFDFPEVVDSSEQGNVSERLIQLQHLHKIKIGDEGICQDSVMNYAFDEGIDLTTDPVRAILTSDAIDSVTRSGLSRRSKGGLSRWSKRGRCGGKPQPKTVPQRCSSPAAA